METCIICRYENAKRYITKQSDKVEEWKYECDMCGKYIVSDDIKFQILKLHEEKNINIYKLQSRIKENTYLWDKELIIDSDVLEETLKFRNKTLMEQYELMLKYFNEFSEDGSLDIVESKRQEIRILSWIQSSELFRGKMIVKAIKDGLMDGHLEGSRSYPTNFTFEGLQYVESLNNSNINSNKIFLAFKFGENKKTFEEIKRFIENDIENIKFQAVIVNQDTTEHDEKISDKIIAELKGARMIVADFSAHSPNVYFEAGYAMGMNIPVIWTCHAEHLKGMAFDVNHFPVIGWENINDLKEKLRDRILRLI